MSGLSNFGFKGCRSVAVCITALALLLGSAPASAHPHVWVTYEVSAVFKNAQLTALRQRWTFDDQFTSAVLGDIGKSKIKTVDRATAAKIRANAFDNLANYQYFQHVNVNGRPINLGAPTDFNVKLKGDQLVYEFSLPLNPPVNPRLVQVTLGLWDSSFFVDYEPDNPKAVTTSGDGANGCVLSSSEDRAHPIFYGTINPLVWKLSC
ncbi:DUF1007 family protein [Amantichitinum ursilacus]|uniref:DUF1007 family protein n=1 Tax=Amantichitinum ursilacus TaxID=857265 RepID=A0A0N0XKJ5_9NEIS|nr:DUF1007 family protein [Amantichitinum ursilacus]KPC54217.1 hypothetical protein WG78_06195 [Amantichitinum ursilacus]